MEAFRIDSDSKPFSTDSQLFEDFVRWLRTRDVSDSTLDTYLHPVHKLVDYLASTYDASFTDDSVKGYMVSNWVTTLQDYKVTTRALYITAANLFLRFLYTMQYISFDLRSALPETPLPDRHYRVHPEERPERRAYTRDEIQAMLDNGTPRTKALVALLTASGLRISELLDLNVRDVFPDGETFDPHPTVARKGTHGNRVTVTIPEAVLPYLREYLETRILSDDSPLFEDERGNRLNRRAAYASLASLQRRLGQPTGCHTYRHTAITNIERQADPVVARDFAGQKSLTITNRYLHSTLDEQTTAAYTLAASLL